MRRVSGWRVNRFQWQRVTLFSSVDAYTYTRCGDCCVQFRPPPLFFTRVRDARSRTERNRLVLLSSRRSPLSRRGSYIPLVTEGNNRHSGRISSLWGCAVSAMVADLRFVRNASSCKLPPLVRQRSSLNVHLCSSYLLFHTSRSYAPP